MGGREGGASKTSSRAACVVGGEGAGLGLWVVGVLGARGRKGALGTRWRLLKLPHFSQKPSSGRWGGRAGGWSL